IIRIARTPIESDGVSPFLGHHTVFAVQVEQYLKGDGPSVAKVWVPCGTIGPATYTDAGNPALLVGEWYVLFLRELHGSVSKRFGFSALLFGKNVFKVGELDELILTEPLHAKLLLRDGRVQAAYDQYNAQKAWSFEDSNSTQPIGQGEPDVIQAIRDAIGATA